MSYLHNIFSHDQSQRAHESVYGPTAQHHSTWSHELVAGAAAFAAVQAYEAHVANTGQPVSHAVMKEMLAAFAAAEIDKLFESKGLDFIDREQTKLRAVHQAHHISKEKYGAGGTFNV